MEMLMVWAHVASIYHHPSLFIPSILVYYTLVVTQSNQIQASSTDRTHLNSESDQHRGCIRTPDHQCQVQTPRASFTPDKCLLLTSKSFFCSDAAASFSGVLGCLVMRRTDMLLSLAQSLQIIGTVGGGSTPREASCMGILIHKPLLFRFRRIGTQCRSNPPCNSVAGCHGARWAGPQPLRPHPLQSRPQPRANRRSPAARRLRGL